MANKFTNLKPGTWVLLKTEQRLLKQYNENRFADIIFPEDAITVEMFRYLGKVVCITRKAHHSWYKIKEDEGHYNWPPEAIKEVIPEHIAKVLYEG